MSRGHRGAPRDRVELRCHAPTGGDPRDRVDFQCHAPAGGAPRDRVDFRCHAPAVGMGGGRGAPKCQNVTLFEVKMRPFALLRDSVRMENAIWPLYSNVSWKFHVFLKTETSHTRARTSQNAISGTDFEVEIVISRFCVSTIYMHIIAPRSTPGTSQEHFRSAPGRQKCSNSH